MESMTTEKSAGVTATERVLFNLVRRPVVLANARLGRYDGEVIWLLGHPRSGTTWLSELINHDKRLRDMFEPIRPKRIERASCVGENEYVRPGADHAELHRLMSDIFSGRFAHPLVDFANRRPVYSGLIVKDVFSNLFAKWAVEAFAHVRPVLLIRNPFAASLSLRKRHPENWPYDPANLLRQPDLVHDHLDAHHDVLARTAAEGTDIEKSLATWAVMNMVPLRQFAPSELHVCFYEDLYADTAGELARLLDFTSRSGGDVELSSEQIAKPSRTADGGNVIDSKSPLVSWQAQCTADELSQGTALLDSLGIGDLYGDGVEPNHAVLERLR